jgi:hypothetical protein
LSFFLPPFLLSADPDLHLTTLAFLLLLRAGIGGRLWAASGIGGRPAASVGQAARMKCLEERGNIFFAPSLSSEAKWLTTSYRLLEVILSTHSSS